MEPNHLTTSARRLRLGLLLLIAAAVQAWAFLGWWAVQAAEATAEKERRVVSDSVTVGRFTFQVRQNWVEDDQLVIRRDKRVVARLRGHRFFLGTMEPEEMGRKNPVILGQDITGDGVPDAVVFEWSGGPHSDYVAHVFSVGDTLERVATINGQHTVPYFTDLDGDGVLEVVLRDWTFSYWPECFASSPAPRIVLRWRNGGYQLAPDLMRTPAPTTRELRRQARALRRSGEWEAGVPPVALWHEVLELLYGGHQPEAWQLLAQSWRRRQLLADAQLVQFHELLSSSPHWRALTSQPDAPPRAAHFARAASQQATATMAALRATAPATAPARPASPTGPRDGSTALAPR